MNSRSTSFPGQAMWDALRRHLESRRRPIQEEIRRYPPPIPACDAHFNHLLEQRTVLSRELVRLEAARQAAGPGADGEAAVRDFIRTSPCINAALAEPLLRELSGPAR